MFPQKTKWFKKPVGWQDLGTIDCEQKIDKETKQTIYSQRAHAFCSTPVHIGKEGDSMFHFCPRCLRKVRSSE